MYSFDSPSAKINQEGFVMLNDFITTQPVGGDGEQGELRVWDAVRSAFRNRDCLGYWRFPVFASGVQREPDIMLIDRQLGLVVIEVKSLPLECIQTIEGYRWHVSNYYGKKHIEPYLQARYQVEALLEYADVEEGLKQRVAARAIVALPLVHSDDWLERGFANFPGSPPVICEDNLSPASLRATIGDADVVKGGKPLSEDDFSLLLRLITGMQYARNKKKVPFQKPVVGRAEVLAKARDTIHQLDLQQERIAKQIPPGPQRIRGIAGSGKTVLLAQKAVSMHLKHPEWDIAVVFFTRSLYDLMEGLLKKWMHYFTRGEKSYDPEGKLKLLHTWGAKDRPGFYRHVCLEHNIRPLGRDDAPQSSPPQKYAYVLHKLFETLGEKGREIQPTFDAILVDEGQDLVFDERFKVDGKQPFYWLAYQSLRPVEQGQDSLFGDSDNTTRRRLIWAYDEAQSLESLVAPTHRELFGDAVSDVMLADSPIYPGGINKNEVMRKCYRTPGQILVAAHSIGMGLFREGGMLSGLTTQEDWRSLGYEVQGDFRRVGEMIHLERPPENSLNIVADLYGKPVLTFQPFASRTDEIDVVAEQIKQDIMQEGLKASRELLVIALGEPWEASKIQETMARALQQRGIDYFVPATPKPNMLKADKDNRKPDKFWYEGAVTVSRIHQAKGNEADVVYVLGFDNIAKREADVNARNQVFVALTRTKGWAHLSGVGEHPLFDEMKTVIKSKQAFSFVFRRA